MNNNNINEKCYDEEKRQLNLSHRNLRSLDAATIATYANCTEYLDLSHNRINNLSWLYEFRQLKYLIMDDNRLREAHFEKLTRPLTNIHTLMLNKNELSDLKMTASILQHIFPNVKYLSLHGNAMCPDNLLLQPFCEFVPYEYNHYRTVLLNSLPELKFLDHFSLESLHFGCRNACIEINQQQLQQKPRQNQLYSATPSQDLWSKVKSFLTSNLNLTTRNFPTTPNNNCAQHCDSSSSSPSHVGFYSGLNSEGNRFITNSDL